MSRRLISTGPLVTRSFGEALGRVVAGPLAILLSGDYGTGKTTFVQGLAAGLGISGPVRSPSYNIMKRYSDGRYILVHADLYRTQSAPEIEELGLSEIIAAEGILAVEWPGRYLPPAREMPSLTISFSYLSKTGLPGDNDAEHRRLDVSWTDNVPANLQGVLRALAARH
jgi:tRNA threonylcarbamoyladenosine biosynthesis protein TsaE